MRLFSNGSLDDIEHSLLTEAKRRVARGDSTSMILLVPTRVRALEILAQLVASAKGSVLSGIECLTISDFSSQLLHRLAPKVRVASDAETAVFLELAIKELQRSSLLKYFEAKGDDASDARKLPMPHGTFELLQNTIRALKEHAVLPEDIAKEIQRSEMARASSTELLRARDIHAIYEHYEAKLGASITDLYGQLALVASPEYSRDHFSQSFRSVFPEVRDIFVFGFLRLERSSLNVLEALVRGVEARLVVEMPDRSENLELFQNLKLVESELAGISLASKKITTLAETAEASPLKQFAHHLSQTLFSETDLSDERPEAIPDFSNLVHIWSAESREEEVEQIARTIKLLFESDPAVRAEPSRICVATPLEREYALLFRSAFARYGIPASVTDRYKLDTAGLTAGLVSILEMVSGGINRRDLLRALSTPYFLLKNRDGRAIDSANLRLVATQEQLVGNSADWKSILAQRSAEIKSELENFSGDDREWKTLLEAERSIERAEEDVESLMEILSTFEQDLTPQEFRESLLHFFGRTQVRARMLEDSANMIAANALEHETRSYGALVALVENLTEICELLNVENKPLPISFYIARLRTAASVERFTPRFDPGSVFVTSLEQRLGSQCDYLFVPGLVDGRFPSRYEPQIFLMDANQKKEELQRAEERLLFYETITSFRKQLFLSSPKTGEKADPFTPSTFLEALKKRIKADEDVPERLTLDLFCERDLQRWSGEEVLQGVPIGQTLGKILESTGAPATPVLEKFVPVALRMQALRAMPLPSDFAGTLDRERLSEEALRMLRRYETHVWSVSQLELYARCPFKFMMQQIFRVDTPETLEEGLDPMHRGSIIHDILYELFTSRRDENLNPIRKIQSDEEREAFHEQAHSIAAKRIDTGGKMHPFYRLDAETLIGPRGQRSLFQKVLDAETELKDVSQRPEYFEVGFGLASSDTEGSDRELRRTTPIKLTEAFQLRGKIDRLDMDPETFSVVDYKTGTPANLKAIKRGKSLQLPLYLRAAQQLLREELELELAPVAAMYSLVREGAWKLGIALKDYSGAHFAKFKSRSHGLFKDVTELNQIIEDSIRQAERYSTGVIEGQFPLIDEEDVAQCKYCQFRSACRQREALKFGTLPKAA